jgi:hypothetical protein
MASALALERVGDVEARLRELAQHLTVTSARPSPRGAIDTIGPSPLWTPWG